MNEYLQLMIPPSFMVLNCYYQEYSLTLQGRVDGYICNLNSSNIIIDLNLFMQHEIRDIDDDL